MHRRTSRRPVRRNSSRRGRLTHGGLKAQEVKGDAGPALRGRIALERGAGVVEFPNVDQFRRIAREEGVPSEMVESAFGHMGGRAPKRRTSRQRVRKNSRPKRQIRRGYLMADTQRSGLASRLAAREVDVPHEEVERFGSGRGVWVDVDGKTALLSAQDAMKLAYPWFTTTQFRQAFGHMLKGSLMGETPVIARIPTTYGPRSMRLGHLSSEAIENVEPDRLATTIGIGRSSIVLFHKPSGGVAWYAIEDVSDGADERKPIIVPPKGGAGRKRKVGFATAMTEAADRNIPPLAFLQAFGHLLDPQTRRRVYRDVSSRS